MAGQSKMAKAKMYTSVLLQLFKQKYANVTSVVLFGFVVTSIVTLARGITRDRQSKTAAVTQKLLQLQKEEKEAKKGKVDQSTFFQRLSTILAICIPGWKSKEAWFLAQLSALLIARTVFSVVIAEMIGSNVMYLVSRNWLQALTGVITFVLISFPASFINTFIKHVTSMLAIRFRVRLSKHVNAQYIKGVNFYAACNLQGITDVDQRVTTDVKQFCEEIAGLYSSLFKPALDILLFTNQLRLVTGWQGPAMLYSYFIGSALVKRVINGRAKFGKLVAGESAREGEYRSAHQRLITNSEEVAFYNGSKRELVLVDRELMELFTYARNHRYVRAAVDVGDQLLIKYWATIAGYGVMWVPILLNSHPEKSSSELTRDYARVSRYLQNVSAAVGELVMVINTLATISGRSRRVSELLETVQKLDKNPVAPFTLRESTRTSNRYNPHLENIKQWLGSWKERCDTERNYRLDKLRQSNPKPRQLQGGGTYIESDIIKFEAVDIVSPEGVCLAKNLNFTVDQGQNVMVTGPNGAGKSSLFRVIGELWPLACGTVTKPMKEDVLFVPQKPYLVTGTMRDQIIYPHSHKQMQERGVTDDDLARLLAVVDPANDLLSTWNFDDEKDWFRAFSGGQKQRIAMARVFYHRPLYAILDECTSAVSSEVENAIYETGNFLGITLFTVSHRDSLKIHHSKVLYIEGIDGGWQLIDVNHEGKKKSSQLGSHQKEEGKKEVVEEEEEESDAEDGDE